MLFAIAICELLSAICQLLFAIAVCYLLFAICCLFFAVCFLLFAACFLLFESGPEGGGIYRKHGYSLDLTRFSIRWMLHGSLPVPSRFRFGSPEGPRGSRNSAPAKDLLNENPSLSFSGKKGHPMILYVFISFSYVFIWFLYHFIWF